jgi:hypothetical protein
VSLPCVLASCIASTVFPQQVEGTGYEDIEDEKYAPDYRDPLNHAGYGSTAEKQNTRDYRQQYIRCCSTVHRRRPRSLCPLISIDEVGYVFAQDSGTKAECASRDCPNENFDGTLLKAVSSVFHGQFGPILAPGLDVDVCCIKLSLINPKLCKSPQAPSGTNHCFSR